MKKPISGVIALVAGAFTAYSQGTVTFGNYAYSSPLVYISYNSTKLGGSETGPVPTPLNFASETANGPAWSVALYGAAGAGQPMSAMTQLFDESGSPIIATLANGVSDSLPGTWYTGDYAVIPGAPNGSTATVQVYAWYNAGGTISNFVAAVVAGVPAGYSATATATRLGGPMAHGPPGFPAALPTGSLGNFALAIQPYHEPPVIAWNPAGPITYGTALSSSQLNASANVAGTFVYSPPVGAQLGAGSATLSVVFTPTDTLSYIGATNTVTLAVMPAPLTITAASQGKTYGQTLGFGSGSSQFSASGLENLDTIGSVTLSVNNNGGAAAAPVTGSPYTITPSAPTGGTFSPGNYNIIYVTGNLTVSPAQLTISSGVAANNKVYNGTTTATLSSSSVVLAGVVSGDTVTLNPGGYVANFASAGVGNGITVTVSGMTLGGASAGNYTLTQPAGLTANITAAPITISSGITANNKVYNNTTTATLSSNSVVLAGVVSGDAVSLNTNAYVANFASAGVGSGITVTVSGLTLGGASAGNYTLTQPAGLTANITAAPITISSGITANNKVYDGATAATLSSNSVVLAGVVSGDTVSLNTNAYLANFASAGVGNGIAVTVSGLTLAGSSAGNYTLAQPSGLAANITAAPLTVSSGIAANSKIYNGTTAATLSSNNVVLAGVVSGDTVSLNTNAYVANFASAGIGNSIAVTVGGLTLAGSSAGNYTLAQPSGVAANITAAPLTVSSGITANNKIYNGTTAATLSSNSVVLAGVVSGDTVSLNTNAYVANFASAGVGNGIAVTVSGLTLAGSSAGNYTLTQPAGLAANITAAPLTVLSGITANNKIYNGTTAATLSSNSVVLAGVVSGDTVSLNTNAYVANFASAGVGNGIGVTVGGLTLGGASAGNYTLTQPAGLTANVTAVPITISSGITANNKVYDGTTAATLSSNSVVLAGVISGDTVSLSTNAYVANFASAGVGNGIAVTVGGITLAGSSALNYTLAQPGGLTANITAAPITVSSGITANNKVYDGTATATISSNSVVLAGVVSGDTVSLNTNAYVANFASAGVANGIAVTVGGLTLGGTSAANYTLTQPASLTANITAAPITINSGITADNKIFNGTTTTTLSSNNVVLAGVVSGDTVFLITNGYAANFANAGVGNGVAVTVGRLSLAGGSAGNYTLIQPEGLIADITPSLVIVANTPTVVNVTNVDLMWSTPATNLVLYFTPSLVPPVTWTPVTNGVTVTGTTYSINYNLGAEQIGYFELMPGP